ncbi:MAG: D-hexose-6-phosphate mutarotase [Bacteroidales bacterium]|nr:D-hexose-6-phosphate mutarotase [Bacteroidales bacterium]MCF8390434.1 D-hexose-6-phosphate mutarotase [Bacteroidales bacterium]
MIQISKEILIQDRISLKEGHGGLRFLELRWNGAEAHIYLHGAHILHYQPAEQQPVLWHSEASWFETDKPIRGGIPICWPWFGPHPNDSDQPAHGFARLTEWEPISNSVTDEATCVTLQLPASSCPQRISLQLTLELSDKLLVSLTTANNSGSDFNYSEALHSYFFIQNIHAVKVSGLEGQYYIDKLSHDLSPQKQKGPIEFSAETDRIYINTTHSTTIVDEVFKRSIHISKENSLSTVVWNPWIDKSIRMPDFGTSEFLNMLCVETANCGPNAVALASGETHKMNLQISARNH